MKKVLFIASHRKDRAPGQRFRFEQYFEFLKEHGYECHLSSIIDENGDKVLYAKGRLLAKAQIALRAAYIRLKNVIHRNDYSIIFIFREAYFTGTTLFESLLATSNAKLIFDFDDAIWHLDVSEANKKMKWMKKPDKTGEIIRKVDLVFAGNKYLANYASKFNEQVVVVPTTIDTDEYYEISPSNSSTVCIGWSGSITTIRHFEVAIPIFKRLRSTFGNKISFKVIGDGSYRNSELAIKGIPWKKDTEIQELAGIDIGIMPLPDDEWSNGKCGLKGLQYMALGIVTVMSPVGVNTEIISDNVNGMLASTEDEWVNKLTLLINNADLRKRLGAAGRKTVVDSYSVNAQKNNYLRFFEQLTQ